MNTFRTKHKHHLRLWWLLIGVAAVSGYVGFFGQSPVAKEQATAMDGVPPEGGRTKNQEQTITTAPANEPITSPTNQAQETNTPAQKQKNTATASGRGPAQGGKNTKTQPANSLTREPNEPSIPTISATLVVNDKTYTLTIPEKSTAYNFMKLLQQKTAFRFDGKDFGGQLGFFVEEINGIKNSSTEKKNWIYYINDKKANAGISTYQLKSNDVINWKYEASLD